MKIPVTIFIISLLLSLSAAVAGTQTLRVGYDEYCPYTCLKSSQKGFALDLLEGILGARGFRLEHVAASWPRIKTMAKNGALDLLVPVNRSEVQELGILRTQNTISPVFKGSVAAYFVHKDSTWTYSGRESLQTQIIGIIQGYTYPEPLNSHLQDPLFKNKQLILASEQGNQRQIRMLATRRITVIPSERAVFWYMARELGLTHQFKDAGVLDMPDDLSFFHIGVVSKGKPQSAEIVQWLDEGLETWKRKGQLKDILQKYGI